jgi:hypothetical protein
MDSIKEMMSMLPAFIPTSQTRDFIQAVDTAMISEDYGVTYTLLVGQGDAMSPSMDPESKLLRRALSAGHSPLQFAKGFAKLHNLLPGEYTHNLYRAALADFSYNFPKWTSGADGRAYLQNREDLLKMDIGKNEKGWSFQILISNEPVELTASADPLGRPVPDRDTTFALVAEGHDIGDTLMETRGLRLNSRHTDKKTKVDDSPSHGSRM